MNARKLCGILVLAALLSAPAATAAETPDQGKALYQRYCATCHGEDGLADTQLGRLLRPRPRRFADPVEMARLTDDAIHRAIREGVPGTAMAGWAGVLTEPQIGDVMDYIRSLRVAAGRNLSERELSIEVGKRIYDKECAFCHGKHGDADTEAARVLRPPPRKFSDPIEMARVDDGRLYSAIKLGRSGTAMAGWGERLSPVEIIDLMRYIRTLQQPLPEGMENADVDLIVGERIYQQYCTTCHGPDGTGKTAIGKVLRPPPRDFTNRRAMAALSDEFLADAIIQGRPGTAMASWGGILNQEDVRRVIRYVRKNFQRQR